MDFLPTWRIAARILFMTMLLSITALSACKSTQEDPGLALIERGKFLEIDSVWEPPPGEAIHHHTAGYAKIMCSAVFITKLDPEDAAANVGGFTAPFKHRPAVVDTAIDYDDESVTLTLASGLARTAKRYKSQGCITLPLGKEEIYFTPTWVEPNIPDPSVTPWPVGDVLAGEDLPSGVNSAKVSQAIEVAMQAAGKTLGFVVTYRGNIIAEAYDPGVGMHTPFESWSMGKSLTGTLMAVLIQQGYVDYAFTIAPAWEADNRPIYGGGFLWRNVRGLAIKEEYAAFLGAGGQFTIIIPSREIVIVRLGKYSGAAEGSKNLFRAIQLLLEAVPD